MQIYKELSFHGDKSALDTMFNEFYNFFPATWKRPEKNEFLKNYIRADYIGTKVPQAEVSIYCGSDSRSKGYIKVGNIVPLKKIQLTIDEYNSILDLFFVDIAKPYCEQHKDIKLEGPTSAQFDPLHYITDKALTKLTLFCNAANKYTGTAHPSDEKRWFDFICQTVSDNRTFDYNTLFNFLIDEEYWGKREKELIEVTGKFAWDEGNAEELASEYEKAVRILRYYKEKY